MALRKRRLQAEPLCRDCAAVGIIKAAVVPDHIVPLTRGGKDTDDNIRCLCDDHHKVRTAQEFGYRAAQELDADGWPIDAVASHK
jgi:5-methylcytosine-specific restriction enzyme A